MIYMRKEIVHGKRFSMGSRGEIKMNHNNRIALLKNRINPIADYVDHKGEFNHSFDDFLKPSGRWLTPSARLLRTDACFEPACDVMEQDGYFIVTLEMAGVKREDIKMEITENQIVISGERRAEARKKEDAHTYSERLYGKFQRAFVLPAGLEASKVEANYQDGIYE